MQAEIFKTFVLELISFSFKNAAINIRGAGKITNKYRALIPSLTIKAVNKILNIIHINIIKSLA